MAVTGWVANIHDPELRTALEMYFECGMGMTVRGMMTRCLASIDITGDAAVEAALAEYRVVRDHYRSSNVDRQWERIIAVAKEARDAR